jgi:hypothetical protein
VYFLIKWICNLSRLADAFRITTEPRRVPVGNVVEYSLPFINNSYLSFDGIGNEYLSNGASPCSTATHRLITNVAGSVINLLCRPIMRVKGLFRCSSLLGSSSMTVGMVEL